MAMVKIQTQQETLSHRMTRWLAVALGLMTAVIVFLSHDNPSITGGAVFQNVYGSASPFVILFVLIVVIYLYHKLR
ncbi:MAG: hypothetical protein AABX72_00440 [Nanoarchaeota archaeon]